MRRGPAASSGRGPVRGAGRAGYMPMPCGRCSSLELEAVLDAELFGLGAAGGGLLGEAGAIGLAWRPS